MPADTAVLADPFLERQVSVRDLMPLADASFVAPVGNVVGGLPVANGSRRHLHLIGWPVARLMMALLLPRLTRVRATS